MALSQDTVKEIFVTTGLAAETTLKTFEATASDGEIGVFNADGSDGDAQGKFLVALKLAGKTITSDLYSDEEIKKLYAVKGSAFVAKVVTVTPTEFTVGKEYLIEVRMTSVGSLSITNHYSIFGQYIVKTSDAAAQVVTGLIASLNKNFSKEQGATLTTNPYFAFSGSTTLIVTEKEQALELGKDEGRQLVFDILVRPDLGVSMAGIVITTPGSPGVATGKQVALMEYFFRGNRGDQFRQQHFPYNWGLASKSQADPTAQYSLIEGLAIRQQDEMFNTANSRKAFVIAVPLGAVASEYVAINAIINKMEVVTGKTVADLAV
jgi:hypothetical protein